jgi:hypothetical protein
MEPWNRGTMEPWNHGTINSLLNPKYNYNYYFEKGNKVIWDPNVFII